VTLTKPYLEALDRLVEEGIYLSKGEIILEALRSLLRQQGVEPFARPLEEKGEQ
jgi:Arc/MetJ-type ribon-helix-helix transcriptional regulator